MWAPLHHARQTHHMMTDKTHIVGATPPCEATLLHDAHDPHYRMREHCVICPRNAHHTPAQERYRLPVAPLIQYFRFLNVIAIRTDQNQKLALSAEMYLQLFNIQDQNAINVLCQKQNKQLGAKSAKSKTQLGVPLRNGPRICSVNGERSK